MMVCVAVSQGTIDSQKVVDIELTPGFVMGALPLLSSMYNELIHSVVLGRAGASPPSRTAAIIFLYIYIYIYIFIYRIVRRALNLVRASFSPIFQYFLTCIVAWRHAPWIRQPWKVPSTLIVTFESEEVLFIEL